MTKEEFDNKISLLKKLNNHSKIKSIKVETLNFDKNEQEINEFRYEINVWQKLTNFDKELGKYYTYEVIAPQSKIKGFEYCKVSNSSQFFIKNEGKIYSSAEDLIFDKFNIRVVLK